MNFLPIWLIVLWPIKGSSAALDNTLKSYFTKNNKRFWKARIGIPSAGSFYGITCSFRPWVACRPGDACLIASFRVLDWGGCTISRLNPVIISRHATLMSLFSALHSSGAILDQSTAIRNIRPVVYIFTERVILADAQCTILESVLKKKSKFACWMIAHDTYNNNSYKSRRRCGGVRRRESERKREIGEKGQLYTGYLKKGKSLAHYRN